MITMLLEVSGLLLNMRVAVTTDFFLLADPQQCFDLNFEASITLNGIDILE